MSAMDTETVLQAIKQKTQKCPLEFIPQIDLGYLPRRKKITEIPLNLCPFRTPKNAKGASSCACLMNQN